MGGASWGRGGPGGINLYPGLFKMEVCNRLILGSARQTCLFRDFQLRISGRLQPGYLLQLPGQAEVTVVLLCRGFMKSRYSIAHQSYLSQRTAGAVTAIRPPGKFKQKRRRMANIRNHLYSSSF